MSRERLEAEASTLRYMIKSCPEEQTITLTGLQSMLSDVLDELQNTGYVILGEPDVSGRQKVEVFLPNRKPVKGVWSPGRWIHGDLGMISSASSLDDIDEAEKFLREHETK